MCKKITVIITTFGHTRFLPRAIRSVLRQTHKNWELIVVDDNGMDSIFRADVFKILSLPEFNDSRIMLITHETNMNGSAARNTGIKQASGDIISFLDDDDEYDACRLERCLSYLNENAGYRAVYTRTKYVHMNGRVVLSGLGKSGNYYVATLACRFEFGTGSNIFFDKSIFDEIGLFDTSLQRHQDYDILARLFKIHDIGYIGDALVTKYMEARSNPGFLRAVRIKYIYLRKHLSQGKGLNIFQICYVIFCNGIDSFKLLVFGFFKNFRVI